jgi:hypothetical protein
LIVQTGVARPTHNPSQYSQVQNEFGVARNVTFTPFVKFAEHAVWVGPGPQLIPAGVLVTDPPPPGSWIVIVA